MTEDGIGDITKINAVEQAEECIKCIELKMWPQFKALFFKIKNYYQKQYKKTAEDDDFLKLWYALRAVAIDAKLEMIQDVANFSDFMAIMKDISEIVNEPRHLWDIMHGEVQTIFRATPEQGRIIASTFFKPEELFEFGMESFLQSNLCDTSNLENEEDIIDCFYACLGFVKACGHKDPTKVPQKFASHIEKLLRGFINLKVFSPQRFVWLVEKSHEHLFIDDTVLSNICSNVISEFSQLTMEDERKLEIASIMSTSPFLSKLPVLQAVIDHVFLDVVQCHREFFNEYILPSFADLDWESENAEGRVSDPMRCWRLYADRLEEKGKSSPIFVHTFTIFVIDSIQIFNCYYGDVQATRAKSADFRRDLIFFVTEIQKMNLELSQETISKLYMLLLMIAVSGADDELISNPPEMKESDNSVLLGLKFDKQNENFADYKEALKVLTKKFAHEKDSFPYLVSFLRAKY